MMIANASQGRTFGLPPELRTAQQAIHLPEVQEMLRRLSEFKLGIFMPHMHDEYTGEFQSLPNDVIQVETDLAVSFQANEEISNQTERFLPVGWCWCAGALTATMVCEMVGDENSDVILGQAKGTPKHKMLNGNQ